MTLFEMRRRTFITVGGLAAFEVVRHQRRRRPRVRGAVYGTGRYGTAIYG